MANVFSNSLHESKTSNIKAIASKNIPKLKKFKKNLTIESKFCFENYSQLLNCEDVDAVYITLPNNYHFRYIVEALNYNKHVLVEKPAFISRSEAQIVKSLKDEKNLLFCEGFMYLHHPFTNEIFNFVKNGTIGSIKKINANIGYNILPKYNLLMQFVDKFKKQHRLFLPHMGGGCIFDLGCYLTSFIQLFTIEKNFIFKQKKSSNAYKSVEVDAKALISFNNDFTTSLHCSFNEELNPYVEIIGTSGNIKANNLWSGKNINIKINGQKLFTHSQSLNPFSLQINTINNCLINDNYQLDGTFYSKFNSSFNSLLLEQWKN